MLWKDLRSVLLGSVGIGVGITLGGLLLSFQYDLPLGPAIILLGAVLLIGCTEEEARAARPLLQRRGGGGGTGHPGLSRLERDGQSRFSGGFPGGAYWPD